MSAIKNKVNRREGVISRLEKQLKSNKKPEKVNASETMKNHIIIFPYDAFRGLFPPFQIFSFEVLLTVVPIV